MDPVNKIKTELSPIARMNCINAGQKHFDQIMTECGFFSRLNAADMNQLISFQNIDQLVINSWLTEMSFTVGERAKIMSTLADAFKKDEDDRIEKIQKDVSFYNYPSDESLSFLNSDSEGAKYNRIWIESRLKQIKDRDVWSEIKGDLLSGSGALIITMALILTIAVALLYQSPCSNVTGDRAGSEHC